MSTTTSSDRITFSFGANWKSFLKEATQEALELAEKDIHQWLGPGYADGKRVLDIGCGSGIHSLGFFSEGAAQLVSFDVDKHSVEATQSLWEKTGRPERWKVLHGSVLDRRFVQDLGPGSFDIVYAWGVLHHTGAMWDAVDNACRMVAPGGRLWLALYVKSASYPADLALKQKYNRASLLGKKWMVWKWIASMMWERARRKQNPFAWNQRRIRGMDTYHDIVDWLGGLPYEVATDEEVVDFCSQRGFQAERVKTGDANNIYLFKRQP